MSNKKAQLGIILSLTVGAKEKKNGNGWKNGSRSDIYLAMRTS
jgi:hypothetical protein